MSGISKSGEDTQTEKSLKKQRDEDVFLRLKHIGYCRSQLTLDEDRDVTMSDFVEFAKHQVCKHKNIMFLDPVWERYHDTDILVEYFSIMFDTDPEFRKKFELLMTEAADVEEVFDWFDAQISKNHEELGISAPAPTETEDDEFDFTPESIGDE